MVYREAPLLKKLDAPTTLGSCGGKVGRYSNVLDIFSHMQITWHEKRGEQTGARRGHYEKCAGCIYYVVYFHNFTFMRTFAFGNFNGYRLCSLWISLIDSGEYDW